MNYIYIKFKECFRNEQVFGPSKGAAQIESSKAWAKDFMQRHSVPTARYRTFTSPADAKEFIKRCRKISASVT